MKTLFAIVMLLVFGAIGGFVSVFLLNLAGLPGALMAGAPGQRSKAQFMFGSVVAALGQSYAYLAFVAFVVNWTTLAAARQDVVGIALWPVAFLVVVVPMWFNVIRARVEAREQEHANPQVEAVHITFVVALLGFAVFALAPAAMRVAWGWVPYM